MSVMFFKKKKKTMKQSSLFINDHSQLLDKMSAQFAYKAPKNKTFSPNSVALLRNCTTRRA